MFDRTSCHYIAMGVWVASEIFEESRVNVKIEMLRPIVQYTYEIIGQECTCTKLTLVDYRLKCTPGYNIYSLTSFK
jgi:hypothetical protein